MLRWPSQWVFVQPQRVSAHHPSLKHALPTSLRGGHSQVAGPVCTGIATFKPAQTSFTAEVDFNPAAPPHRGSVETGPRPWRSSHGWRWGHMGKWWDCRQQTAGNKHARPLPHASQGFGHWHLSILTAPEVGTTIESHYHNLAGWHDCHWPQTQMTPHEQTEK